MQREEEMTTDGMVELISPLLAEPSVLAEMSRSARERAAAGRSRDHARLSFTGRCGWSEWSGGVTRFFSKARVVVLKGGPQRSTVSLATGAAVAGAS